jgi:transposase InsO family protein
MFALVSALWAYTSSCFHSKHELALEVMALRHQIAILKRRTRKPKLRLWDRYLWMALKRAWPRWGDALMIFQPQTVIAWQRMGFRIFWRWKSRHRSGRPGKDPELVQLIRRMWARNPSWGSPRIRDELAKLGLQASSATVRKYRPSSRRRPSQSWRTFLQNHAAAIAAIDFFVVPTVTFRLLYVLIIIRHERRTIVHFNITEAPSAAWTAQQVVNAFPDDTAPEYVLRDRDSIYGPVFARRVDGMGIQQKLIAPRSPWQSPYVERLIGSIRRECLDQIIVINQAQLHQTLQSYFEYYQKVRPHRSLAHDSPLPRPIEPPEDGKVIEVPLVGGLHHQYLQKAA